jgi:hypothetical protein
MTPQKVNNHTTKDLNVSEVDEMSNIELKGMMTRMTNEMKENIYKHFNVIKENTNKQFNEIRKTI